MSEFRAEAVELAPDAALLTIRGTVGALDVDDLRGIALDATARRLVVDTTHASVDDPGVIEVLLDLARARRAGLVALVAPTSGELHRVLEATGFDAALSLYPDLRSALDDLDLPSPA